MGKQKIESPVEGFNGSVVGVQFTDGVGHTDDEAALSYFDRQGYKVAGVVDEDVKRDYPLGDPSDKWTVKELTAYAADRKIDLGKAKGKDEIWNAIKPGGTPYKGVTTPEGEALVNDSTDPKDGEVKDQTDLPPNAR
ncbi:hypothetical protein [Herbiconiux sp. YIM B11900]|uniref:hypothetical protein n=1 Tax=Herbiconiux sp. YIM B11900 TaxID=3404131 RepID=UPI003F86F0F4